MPEKKNIRKSFWRCGLSFRIIPCYATIRQNKPFPDNTFSMREPTFRRPQSLYETVWTIYFHHFSWSHKCILCKHDTTFELSLIYSTLYMAFPRQPLLFTETVPHMKLWRGTKLGSGRWDLASCQVSLNSIQRFQRRSQKCLS